MVSEAWHSSLVKYKSTCIDESIIIHAYVIILVANAIDCTVQEKPENHQRMIFFGTSTFLLPLVMMTLVFGNGENYKLYQTGRWGGIMQ